MAAEIEPVINKETKLKERNGKWKVEGFISIN